MEYRKEIDGLRAVAVLPVIFFHAGFDLFSGGFVGVDIFFVISGYLITTIILTEREIGTFTITNFYERRARRILPALFFVMLACLPFVWDWMFLQQRKDFAQSLIAVSLFSSNILFWIETNYFAGAAELKPLLHTWSLAVEEQYYVLFPLFILITWRFGKQLMVTLLIVICLASISYAELSVETRPSATFYLLPTRLWELLIGSLTAFYLLHLSNTNNNKVILTSSTNQILSAIGLSLILYSIFVFDKETPFPSLYTLIPTLGTALIIIFGSQSTFSGMLLSNKLFVGIGLISYSAYLWHQPLFAFARIRSIEEPSGQLRLALGLLSLGLAYATWKYIEKPFRDKKTYNRKTIFLSALAFSIVFGGIGAIGHITNGFHFKSAGDGSSISQLSHRIRANFGLSQTCDKSFTTSKYCRTGEKPEIVVWGDSYAMHLVQGILASNPEVELTQMTSSSCGPIIGLAITNKENPIGKARDCLKFNNDVIDWIKENRTVKYIVLASPFSQYLNDNNKFLTDDGLVPQSGKLALELFSSTLDDLRALGVTPVVFAPPPRDDRDIGACLVKSISYGEDLNHCNIQLDKLKNNTPLSQFLSRLEHRYRIIRVSDAICEEDACHTEIDGTFIYRDEGHLSYEGSAYLGKKMDFYKLITSDT